MWDLEKAIAPYDEWLNFVNFHFLFEDHPTKMTMDMVVMSIASWNGKRMDWAKVIEENLLKKLWIQPQALVEKEGINNCRNDWVLSRRRQKRL
jgi:hypothetical protein